MEGGREEGLMKDRGGFASQSDVIDVVNTLINELKFDIPLGAILHFNIGTTNVQRF